MRSAAARARSGVENVAITASPIVLTTATSFGRHDLVQYAEMLADEVVSDQIAHALVECCRALEIERIGVKKIAKCLIGEEPFSGKERPPLGEKMMKRVAGNPRARAARAGQCGSQSTNATGRAAAPPCPVGR